MIEDSTVDRKRDHIRINLEEDVQFHVASAFDDFRFTHNALPEVDFNAIDLASNYLGFPVSIPIMISCMTGGTEEAATINRLLAATAQEHGLAMGLGSCRVLLENPELLSTFQVRDVAPDVPLSVNLGAVQLNRGVTVVDCLRLLDQLQANVLVLHLNPLQEALQPSGDTCFSGVLDQIAKVCAEGHVPVVVKEVGWGLSISVIHQLANVGVTGIDIAGAGGTSWSLVESSRSPFPWLGEVGRQFADWGNSTANILDELRAHPVDLPVIASGGIRNGVDVAKAIALGAHSAGIAGPFLRHSSSPEELSDFVRGLEHALRCVMFCTGSRNLEDLQSAALLRSA